MSQEMIVLVMMCLLVIVLIFIDILNARLLKRLSDQLLAKQDDDKRPRFPKLNLLCLNCGERLRPIAVDTGDSWALGLDCKCQKLADKIAFEWPSEKETLSTDELEEMGFEII